MPLGLFFLPKFFSEYMLPYQIWWPQHNKYIEEQGNQVVIRNSQHHPMMLIDTNILENLPSLKNPYWITNILICILEVHTTTIAKMENARAKQRMKNTKAF